MLHTAHRFEQDSVLESEARRIKPLFFNQYNNQYSLLLSQKELNEKISKNIGNFEIIETDHSTASEARHAGS